MNFLNLPSIHYNNNIHKHIITNKLGIPYKSQFSNDTFSTDNNIIINKTLNKYLNFTKEQIESCLDQWDKYKKCTNPYEYIHSIIPNTKQSVSLLKPISRSFFKMIEICHSLCLIEKLPPVCNSFHLVL